MTRCNCFARGALGHKRNLIGLARNLCFQEAFSDEASLAMSGTVRWASINRRHSHEQAHGTDRFRSSVLMLFCLGADSHTRRSSGRRCRSRRWRDHGLLVGDPADHHCRRSHLVLLAARQKHVAGPRAGTRPWHQTFISSRFDVPDCPIDRNPAYRPGSFEYFQVGNSPRPVAGCRA
jgi:hypothetical protein